MKNKSIYLLAQYVGKPKDPRQTKNAGYINDANNLSYDEVVGFTVGLKDKDLLKSNVVLNISEQKVVRNTFNSGKSYDELFEYFREAYPEYMKHFITTTEPTEVDDVIDVQPVQAEEETGN